MRVPSRLAAVPPLALAALGCLWLCLLMGMAGCRASTVPKPETATTTSPDAIRSRNPSRQSPARTAPDRVSPAEPAADKTARLREEKINTELERVSGMLRGNNFEGALRVAERIQAENAADPNVTMRTSYLKAMIYHRMNDAGRRKEAMNQMLKSMETLQKDPRFREAYEDGKANAELIKMSVDEAGKKYGAN